MELNSQQNSSQNIINSKSKYSNVINNKFIIEII